MRAEGRSFLRGWIPEGSPWLGMLLALVLASFATLEIIAVDHGHLDGAVHHSCAICQAAHLPVLKAPNPPEVGTPLGVEWRRPDEPSFSMSACTPPLRPSRAPPV